MIVDLVVDKNQPTYATLINHYILPNKESDRQIIQINSTLRFALTKSLKIVIWFDLFDLSVKSNKSDLTWCHR